MADLDVWLPSGGGVGTLSSFNIYNDPSTGTGINLGDHCSGCWHIDATNDGMRSNGTQGPIGGLNTLFGCPNGGVHPNTIAARDNITCCDFEVECATGTTVGYDDGVTMGTPIPGGIAPNNQSQITTLGSSPQTHNWDAVGVFGSIIEKSGLGCTF